MHRRLLTFCFALMAAAGDAAARRDQRLLLDTSPQTETVSVAAAVSAAAPAPDLTSKTGGLRSI